MDQFPENSISYCWRESRAIFHLSDALHDLESLLHQFIPIHAAYAALPLHGESHNESHDQDEISDRETSSIISEFWAHEEKIRFKTELVCLMSAIKTEDNLNKFIAFNRPGDIEVNFEKKSRSKKVKLVLQLVGSSLEEGGAVLEESSERLAVWRNAFAHGHGTDRKAEPLLANHQPTSAEYLNFPSELRNAIDFVLAYLSVDNFLRSNSRHTFTARISNEAETIKRRLEIIKRFVVKESGNNYTIFYVAP